MQKKNRLLLFLAFVFVLMPMQAQQSFVIQGKVSCKGKGLADVVVSDGKTCVLTDKNGAYTIPFSSKEAEFVYVSTPAGYLPDEIQNVPQFYQRINWDEARDYNFEIKKNKKNDNHHLLLVHADPQFFKEEQFISYAKIIEDCKETLKDYKKLDVFGLDCGDLVGDKPEFYSKYIEELNKLNLPFYRVLGNHDMNYYGRSDETSTRTYKETFGPDFYSFNRGKVHYVVLNNVFYLGREFYYIGYITEKIFHWLEQDLSYVPKGSLVFVAMHIPARLQDQIQNFKYSDGDMARQTINAAALFKILEPFNAHILTGHTHCNQNIIHSPNLYEHNTAAICGAWWQGPLCTDGTPIGYGVYEVKNDELKWYYKSAGHDRNYQMRAYPVGSYAEFPNDVVVNVWNWDKEWKVEWSENGTYRGSATRFEGIDLMMKEQCADKENLEFKWISPTKNDHMFRFTPLLKNSVIEITATDSFGNKYKETVKQ